MKMKTDRRNITILGVAMAASLAFTGQSLQAVQADNAVDAAADMIERDEQYSYFRPGQAVVLPPPDTDCESEDHRGRMIVDKNTGDLWTCSSDGWEVMAIIQ